MHKHVSTVDGMAVRAPEQIRSDRHSGQLDDLSITSITGWTCARPYPHLSPSCLCNSAI